MMSYRFSLKDKEFEVTDEQLFEFIKQCDLLEEIKLRISKLFWLELYFFDQESSIKFDDILCEIKNLEFDKADSQTKSASQFSFKPLKGLWHKHFFLLIVIIVF